MKNGVTENFLAIAIFAAIFSVLMMTGSMLYAIIEGFDNGTDITRTAENDPEAAKFDPNVLPAPAAGIAGKDGSIAYNCKDMIYQVTEDGVKYVRELGGVYNAAIINGQFGLYKLDYGHLQPVENSVLDPDTIRKLRYALETCKEFYIRSGVQMLTATDASGSLG
jgi:hypothetical protein